MIKKLCLTIILVAMLILLSGCGNTILYNQEDTIATLVYHKNNPLQLIEYNKKTGITVSYIYEYAECGSCFGDNCVGVTVVSTDTDGNIIATTEK